MDGYTQLERYLVQVAGDRIWLQRLPAAATRQLPLFLREKYGLAEGDLFGRKLLFAIEKPDARDTTEEVTATGIANELQVIRRALGNEVALVLQPVLAHVRNRLVQQHVPFIIPGTQMFLPMMMVDLREHYARRGAKPLQQLSTAAQLIVLYHLVRQPLDQAPQAAIADLLGYSRMAISRAHEELQNVRLCEIRRSGREVFLEFLGAPRTVWETAEPLLKSPVRKTHWIHWQSTPRDLPLAGTTALAKLTMLNEESVPTFAIRERFVQVAWSDGRFSLAPGRDGADARLEGWIYDPALLSPHSGTVDPCSLYLSLRATADERVQKELQHLLDKVFV